MLIALLHLVWRMIFRFNKFDWNYCKRDVFSNLIFNALFWPFLLIKVDFLNYPENMFDNWQARHERMLLKLARTPPPCGNTIYFRSKKVAYSEEPFGDFTFFAGDIEDYLVSRIEENHCPEREETRDILNWIKRRSSDITDPCYVPEAWHIFGHHASEMLSEGFGDVFCTKCCVHYQNDALIVFDDDSKPYHFYSYLDCPEGHHLIVAQAFHIMHNSMFPDPD